MKNDKNSKLVSIGLPTYNRSQELTKVIEGFLFQTYRNLEIIISDNCSSDDTQKICEEYSRQDGRIRYFRQKENIGHARNFNFVLDNARGEYYMMASDDDWWAPTFVEKLVEALDKNLGYDIAMSSFARVRPDGSLLNTLIFKGEDDLTQLSYGETFYKIAYPIKQFNYFIYGISKTEFFRRFFRNQPNYARGDRVIVCEMALSTHLYCVEEILYKKSVPDGMTLDRHQDIKRPSLRRLEVAYYFYNLAGRIVFSPIVPFHRKLIYFIPYYLKALWRHRWRVIRGFTKKGAK